MANTILPQSNAYRRQGICFPEMIMAQCDVAEPRLQVRFFTADNLLTPIQNIELC